jgi:hypothetical protein
MLAPVKEIYGLSECREALSLPAVKTIAGGWIFAVMCALDVTQNACPMLSVETNGLLMLSPIERFLVGRLPDFSTVQQLQR